MTAALPAPPGAAQHGRGVHRAGAADRRAVHPGQRAGVRGRGHQQHAQDGHQLLPGLAGRGRRGRGAAGHPLRRHHQRGAQDGLPLVPLPGLLRPGPHPELHLQPAGRGRGPVRGHPHPAQVQEPRDGEAGPGPHRRPLDPLVRHRPDAADGLEQLGVGRHELHEPDGGRPAAAAGPWRLRGGVPLRERGHHELHGVLQLLRLRAAAAAGHAGGLRQDLRGGLQAAAADGAARELPHDAAEGGQRRQVAGHHRGLLRPVLAAAPRPQLPQPLPPELRQEQALLGHEHVHHPVARQLRHQPHHLRLQDPGLPVHLPQDPPAVRPLQG